MTFVEPHRITSRIRIGSTQALLIQAFAHLDAAQLPFLGGASSKRTAESLNDRREYAETKILKL